MHTTDMLVMNSFGEITNITQKCFQQNAESSIKSVFVASLASRASVASYCCLCWRQPSSSRAHIALAALPAQGWAQFAPPNYNQTNWLETGGENNP